MELNELKVEISPEEKKYYPIIIGSNILTEVGAIVKKYLEADKIIIVTNNTVKALYGSLVENSLVAEGYEVDFAVISDGEKYKNTASLEKIWDKCLEFKVERKDAIVALGGGVIGDIAGFAASTVLRGIDYIQIPTTLLAQVDSSVGGKVAVNSKYGKNLIGTFYQPKVVISDIEVLKTLTEEELKTGLGEVLKYAFIEKSCGCSQSLDDSFINFLMKNKDSVFDLEPLVMTKLIKYCCQLKASVVNQDEKEHGLRVILNFGHTIGHAIEKCTEYKCFTHGQAVVMGMIAAFDIAKNINLIDEEYNLLALDLLWQYKLNYHIPESININDIINSMKFDKKVINKKERFILPVSSANVAICTYIEESIIHSAIKKLY